MAPAAACVRSGGGKLARRQRPYGRPLEDIAVDGEARPVARAVPAAFGGVPADDAAEMGAAGRERMERPVIGIGQGHLPAPSGDDAALRGGDLGVRRRAPSDAVAHEAPRDIGVLAGKLLEARWRPEPFGAVDLTPSVGTAEHAVAQ